MEDLPREMHQLKGKIIKGQADNIRFSAIYNAVKMEDLPREMYQLKGKIIKGQADNIRFSAIYKVNSSHSRNITVSKKAALM